MIHQYIFAGPKPGLDAAAFQSYWINFHAVDFAAKIPQIRQYLVSARRHIDHPREVSFFEGVAEIWLANDAEQLASLQSPEFIQGARADEPRWAAFWNTMGIDTDPRVSGGDEYSDHPRTKVYVLVKRSPSASLDEFGEQLCERHPALIEDLPGIRGYAIGTARALLYGLGEPRFDAVETWIFDDVPSATEALASTAAGTIEQSWSDLADTRYVFTMVGDEHWVIPPGGR